MDQRNPYLLQILKKLLHFIRHHAVRLSNRSHIAPGGVCIEIRGEMEQRIYNDIFVDGDYDEAILKLLAHADVKTFTVLDLGSNVLFFTFRLIQLAWEKNITSKFSIQCVEASENLIAESQKRIQKSLFSKEQFQVTVTQGLIGQQTGSSLFYHFKDHGLSSIFRQNGHAKPLSFLNVSELLKDSHTIDLLKCDIEGSEGDFIKNYPELLEKTNLAIVEFHTEFCQLEDCTQMIKNAGLVHNKIIRQSPYSRIVLFWR